MVVAIRTRPVARDAGSAERHAHLANFRGNGCCGLEAIRTVDTDGRKPATANGATLKPTAATIETTTSQPQACLRQTASAHSRHGRGQRQRPSLGTFYGPEHSLSRSAIAYWSGGKNSSSALDLYICMGGGRFSSAVALRHVGIGSAATSMAIQPSELQHQLIQCW